jgi:hypothetical protein
MYTELSNAHLLRGDAEKAGALLARAKKNDQEGFFRESIGRIWGRLGLK